MVLIVCVANRILNQVHYCLSQTLTIDHTGLNPLDSSRQSRLSRALALRYSSSVSQSSSSSFGLRKSARSALARAASHSPDGSCGLARPSLGRSSLPVCLDGTSAFPGVPESQ